MAPRYNSPPNWPAPPQGWTPPPGWEPDAEWGPAPPGWQIWGEEAKPTRKPKPWAWIAAVVVALLVGVGIGSSGSGDATLTTTADPTTTTTVTAKAPDAEPGPTVTATKEVAGPETTKTVTAQPPKPKGTIPGDGIWLVGSDIKAGTYRGGDDGCYFARLSGLSGELDDLIANGNPSGPVIVTIKKSDKAFESQSCGDWERIS